MIYFFDNYENFKSEKFIDFLPKERKEKFDRFRFQRDKDNCLAAYLIFLVGLKEYGIHNTDIALTENGKPYLKSNEICFNISHCSQGVAVAFSQTPVGIDVQEIEPVSDGVMKRIFTQNEIESVKTAEDFTTVWTLKESVVKCKGEVLADMEKYSFEQRSEKFEKYGKRFSVFRHKNIILSVCSDKQYDDIKIINDFGGLLK